MSRSKSMWTSAKRARSSRLTLCELRVNRRTNGAVESRRATATYTIFLEGFYGASFDSFVASETGDVVAGKIKDLLDCHQEKAPVLATINYQ